MSNALAIAGVTEMLRNHLHDGLLDNEIVTVLGTTPSVTIASPDTIIGSDGAETSQLNLFLHRVTPNAGWSNEQLPSRDGSGRNRLRNPPLALDLHFLLSAYSPTDLHREILLGFGMQLLHETPVIGRQAIRDRLEVSGLELENRPAALRALVDTGLAEQIEQLRITPEYLNTEEMSKLWTATTARYRPSATYHVSVVLIEAEEPSVAPLPVLSRGPLVNGRERGVVARASLIPPVPVIEKVVPEDQEPVAHLGADVELQGHNLDGNSRQVHLRNDRFRVDELVSASGDSQRQSMHFSIPTASADDFPVGFYQVAARLIRPPETEARTTNYLALVVAPTITTLPASPVVRDGDGTASFTLGFHPELRPGQSVSLFLGQHEYAPEEFSAPATSLDFEIPDALPGDYPLRLRVDGIDSPIIDRTSTPPSFNDRRITIT